MTQAPGDHGENPDLTLRWPGGRSEARSKPSKRTEVQRRSATAESATVEDEADSSTGTAGEPTTERKLLRLRLPVERQTPHNHADPTPGVATTSENDLVSEIRSLRTEAAWLRDEVERLRQRVKELGG